ncbi:MAG: hypothetical protein C0399_09180 [Syntrophus sp. (in: bacteria)]|nr:hypothetical protein [Syntrophus sp. (in: bacteria)]
MREEKPGEHMQCAIVRNQRGTISKFLVYAIIFGALGYGYYYFQSTPRYALIQFKKAIMFSDKETAEKYLDIDSFMSYLPKQTTGSAEGEALKKRILYEIDSPHEKSLFIPVKHWTVFTVSINISGDTAAVEQNDGTTIALKKLNERQWIITAIHFKSKESDK